MLYDEVSESSKVVIPLWRHEYGIVQEGVCALENITSCQNNDSSDSDNNS